MPFSPALLKQCDAKLQAILTKVNRQEDVHLESLPVCPPIMRAIQVAWTAKLDMRIAYDSEVHMSMVEAWAYSHAANVMAHERFCTPYPLGKPPRLYEPDVTVEMPRFRLEAYAVTVDEHAGMMRESIEASRKCMAEMAGSTPRAWAVVEHGVVQLGLDNDRRKSLVKCAAACAAVDGKTQIEARHVLEALSYRNELMGGL